MINIKRYRIPGSLETYSTRGRAALAIAARHSWPTNKLYVRTDASGSFFAWSEGKPEVEISVVDEELEARLRVALTAANDVVGSLHSHYLAS